MPGPSDRADIPRVAALELADGGCLVTCGKRYCIIAGGDSAEVRVQGELEHAAIMYAATHGDEFCLITSMKTLQRRELQDGSLFREYLLNLQLATVEYLAAVEHTAEQSAEQITVGQSAAGYTAERTEAEAEICLADKFGDVTLTTWAAIAEKSTKTARSIYRHLKMFPNDLPFAQKFEWIEKYLAENQVAVADIDEEATQSGETQSGDVQLGETAVEEADPETDLNKFDSGKPLEELLRQYDEEMGPSLMGHLASVTFMRLVRWRGTTLCLTGDRDEKVRVSCVPELWEVQAVLCGHSQFVVDAVLVSCTGRPHIVSVAGDRTLRCWSLVDERQVGAAVLLPSMPVSLVVPACAEGEGVIVFCITTGEKTLHRFRVAEDGRLSALSAEALATAPLAMSKTGRFWVGEDGRIWRRRAANIQRRQRSHTTAEGWDLVGHIDPACTWLHLWKHDREEDALSQEERIAKRLRHAT
ncbi:hypothetical protein GNI_100690 [Gregarina niphandrodes]|uniref:WD domain, G-beta repeat protein n=1 Tax=Gregarina niphandrodes TaxID=110365 RepID=A0A023B4J8_GRENI|nr:hypothetical protein GNI_100690 [Gregarina niphandrodes]EZG56836.1 hypothetical protein GNI_100690 [Gregarina niphandrodes]|eukprot:XP_011131141.1 hypothetical protein GNI_100690 [Gregarina niphandrodes]